MKKVSNTEKRIMDAPKKVSIESWWCNDSWDFFPRITFIDYLNCCDLHIGFLGWLCVITIRKRGW